jgi:hypothetical protein
MARQPSAKLTDTELAICSGMIVPLDMTLMQSQRLSADGLEQLDAFVRDLTRRVPARRKS